MAMPIIDIRNINSIVLEGGGIKGAAYMDFFRTIEQRIPNFLDQIEQYAGTSAGSIIVACFAVGKSLNEIEGIIHEFAELDAKDFGSSCCCCCMNPLTKGILALRNFLTGYGPFQRGIAEKFLRSLFRDPVTGKDYCFAHLEKRLIITATNLNTHKVVFFSNELTPYVPIYKAVMASTCIPFVFQPIPYNFNPQYPQTKHLLVDGGQMMNLPIKAFDANDPYVGVDSEYSNPRVLGVRLDSPEDLQYLNGTVNEKIRSPMEFIFEYTDTFYYNAVQNIRDDARTVSIITKKYAMDDLDLAPAKQRDLSEAGIDAATKFLQANGY